HSSAADLHSGERNLAPEMDHSVEIRTACCIHQSFLNWIMQAQIGMWLFVGECIGEFFGDKLPLRGKNCRCTHRAFSSASFSTRSNICQSSTSAWIVLAEIPRCSPN